MTAPGFIPRLHGPVLTDATPSQLFDCIRRGQYNAQKVITAWGPQGQWTDATRAQVVNTVVIPPYPPKTIVRTLAGDGQYSAGGGPADQRYNNNPANPWLYPLPDRVEAEIAPWYALDPKIYIEIGNEPNNETWWNFFQFPEGTTEKKNARDFIYNWRYWFGEALKRVRECFPQAKVISPGLAGHFEDWYTICRDVFAQANFVGLHAFAPHDFYGADTWNTRVIKSLRDNYGDRAWFCTEYGLHAQPDASFQRTKGQKYAELVHFNRSEPAWPDNVKGACYFHLDTRSQSDRPQYVIYHAGGDDAYRERKDTDLNAGPTDRIGVNGRLNRGSALRSPNGRYTLHLQAGDGNLVLYNAAGVAIWSSYRPGGDFLVLQADNNLVVYQNAGGAVWASNTFGSGAQVLVVQDDGNMVLYSATQAVWATNTVGR